MPFLPPNQQCESTDGQNANSLRNGKYGLSKRCPVAGQGTAAIVQYLTLNDQGQTDNMQSYGDNTTKKQKIRFHFFTVI